MKKTFKILLWTLSWIIFFPVPLSLIILKKKNHLLLRILLVIALWVFIIYAIKSFDAEKTFSEMQNNIEIIKAAMNK